MAKKASKAMARLAEDLEAFQHYIQGERSLSRHTCNAYQRDLNRFARWALDGMADPYHPGMEELASFIAWMTDAEKLEPASIARHLASLRSFYRFLKLEERVRETAVTYWPPRPFGKGSRKYSAWIWSTGSWILPRRSNATG